MDRFADIFRAMHLSGGIFLDAEFTAPWCVAAKVGPEDCRPFAPVPHSIIAFHYVSSGRMLLLVDEQLPIEVERGDIVVLPRNDEHRLASHPNLEPVSAEFLIQPGADGRLAHIEYGGGGALTQIVCGFLGSDRHDDPVLNMLPTVLKLKVEEDALGEWIESSFRFAAREMSFGLTESPATLAKLAELLFMEAVRRYVNSLPGAESRWCDGARDPRIARALSLLHGQIQRRWTAEQLAREAGMSRSAFAERFTRIMGESPMRYLTRIRLHAASHRLKESNESIGRIALAVGYESEAAFHRAFKREFGVPPATWRKQQ